MTCNANEAGGHQRQRDEIISVDCTDADWQFHCADKLRCIDRRRRCDGRPDCKDGSDEDDCKSGKPLIFIISIGIHHFKRILNYIAVPCDYWQFKCVSSGICMDSRRRCDNIDDCSDGSDEMDCESSSEERRGNVSQSTDNDGRQINDV